MDKFYLDAGRAELFDYATESLRIEASDLVGLDSGAFAVLAAYYECKKFTKKILKLIRTLKNL